MLRIEPLDLLATAAASGAVQAAALGPLPRDRFAVLARHSGYPGFAAYGAYADDRLVGYCYGTDCHPGQWWFDQIRTGLCTAGHRTWTLDAHAVTELHVLPAYQGLGCGFALLQRLLAGTALPTALLSTYDAHSPARELYRRCGFVDLVADFRFGLTAQPFALMGARLPLRLNGAEGEVRAGSVWPGRKLPGSVGPGRKLPGGVGPGRKLPGDVGPGRKLPGDIPDGGVEPA